MSTPTQLDLDALATATAGIVRVAVAKALEPLIERLALLEAREIPDPVPVEAIANMIGAAVNNLTAEKDRDIEAAVNEACEHIATATEAISDRLDQLEARALPVPEHAIAETIARLVSEGVTKAVALLPPPLDPVGVDRIVVDQDGIMTIELSDGDVREIGSVRGPGPDPEMLIALIRDEVATEMRSWPVPKDGAGVVDAIVRRDGATVLLLSNGQTKELIPAPEPIIVEHGFDETCPDEIAEMVAASVKMMAEMPDLVIAEPVREPPPAPVKQLPITLNINGGGATPQPTTTRKTVTTRKGADGNLVADIVETVEPE